MQRFIISPLFALSKFFINIYGIFLKFFLQLNGGYWSRIGLAENITEERIKKRGDKKYEIFGKGGGQTLANENNLPLLAQIPIEIPLVDDSNKGVPISISQPNKESSVVFDNLAQLIKNQFVNT